MRTLWFKAKKYGWGWYPVTWQGWLIIFLYITFIVWTFRRIDGEAGTPTETLVSFLPQIIIATAILIIISYLKGEKPRWHWGDDEK